MGDLAHPVWFNFFRKLQTKESKVAELWRETPLFEGFPYRRCLQLVKQMHLRQYQPDETVFKRGEVGIGVALIVSGQVNIRTGERELAQLRSGDFFGEVALAMDEARTADAIAVEPTELLFFLRPDLDELVQTSPRDGAILLHNLSRILAKRLRRANELLSHESHR